MSLENEGFLRPRVALGLVLLVGVGACLVAVAPVAAADPVHVGEDESQVCVFVHKHEGPGGSIEQWVCLVK